ncbi:tyrosine-type recombinase/integrase [Rhizobium leguminosarum]|uniref:tyrosine-type recombinase/integrase n=1 Tax=Rhizobium TaxID=379 RepID=UPI001C94EC22|nr:tyrosine-type recombinase/integrase [Rhizobium leguminosarum]MBY5482250.1 tyrosine-type recombinase/integrase [Rhizobium leguminosarum]
MSTMLASLEQYLALRRSLGFKLHSQESRLRKFVEYAHARGQHHITAKLAVEWAEHQCGPRTWSSRLSTVRSFSRHVALTDPKTEIPPSGIFASQRRPRPFIYSDEQVADLLNAMPRLHPGSFRGVTYHYFFGLLASTGMRFSEAARLLREDADMDTGTLTIRETKFGKSRYIPLHPSTLGALRRYCEERDRFPTRRASKFFFTGDRGRGLNHANPHFSFILWTREAGLRGASEAEGPRIHDLRHTFAVRTLLDWYRNGDDVDLRIPELATYLGHGKVADTYWYLSAHPDLLEEAKLRLDARWEASQ